jgi:hypothetical protein
MGVHKSPAHLLTKIRWAIEDIDGDGDEDLISHFRTQECGLTSNDTEASLTGSSFLGRDIFGTDSVRTVPPNKADKQNRGNSKGKEK